MTDMTDMTDITHKPCPKCGQPAGQIINATEQVRRGWWCESCNHFDDAVGRERLLEKENL